MIRTRRALRGLHVLLVGVLSLTLSMGVAPARAYEPLPTSPFTDVPTTSPYYEAISWMYESGISTGWPDKTYRPTQQVDRDAMAAFIYRYKNQPPYTAPATSPFTDIWPAIQFYKEMTWLESQGITTGWPDKTYRPWTPTNRDAMAAFMYRTAGEPVYTPPTTSPFTDVTPTTQFYKEMCWAAEKGIAQVVNGKFDPWSVVTRQMMATFMYGLAQSNTTLGVDTGTLPDGVAGVDYAATLKVRGGTAPYTWSQTGLPAGLVLSQAGAISGKPTAVGASSVIVTVTDKDGATASRTISLTVTSVSVTTSSLPNGSVGATYNATLAASGGVAPYTWSQTGLPAGLTMSAAGVITGKPTANGTTAVTVKVTDNVGFSASKTMNLVVSSVSITTSSLPEGFAGGQYDFNLAASGGTAPYTWTATGVPSGMTLDTDGWLHGSPTSLGTRSLVFTVTDANGAKATRTLSLKVSEGNCDVLNCIAITFDDGPLQYANNLVDAFYTTGTKATFFLVGERAKANQTATKWAYQAGMEVGVHGWQHLYYTNYGYNYIHYDFEAAGLAIESATGHWPNVMRPPYGYYNNTVNSAAGALGMANIMWTDNAWDYEYTNATYLRNDVVDMARRDSVILMHDGYAATRDAMPGIISDLKAQGYTLVTVEELLGYTPRPGVVYFDEDPILR